MADSIMRLSQLTVLKLDGLYAPAGSFWPLLALKVSALANLRHLGMAAAFGTEEQYRMLAAKLASNVARLPRISSWCLRSCHVDPPSAVMLVDHLVSMTALSSLDLDMNQIGLQGAESIARSLACMPAVRILTFGSEVPGCGKDAVHLGLEECHGPDWRSIVQCHFPT